MLKTPKPIFVSCSWMVLVALLVACQATTRHDILTMDTLASRINHAMRQHYPQFSGTILVAQKDQGLMSQGYGLADQEQDVPNTPQTRFAIGSITKSFTAMAIVMLKERGLLTLQDSICYYLSDCPAGWEPITLQQLLTHTSGIYDLALNPDFQKTDTCREHKPEELLTLFKDHALDFPPGSQFHYSSSGYLLLGMVIEKVSGEGYEGFVQKNILQPLGMTNTDFNHISRPLRNRATGYSQDSWTYQKIKAPCYDSSMFFGDGGLYSTVQDLYKWDQALYTDRLVSNETLSQIFTSTVTVVASPEIYVPPGIWFYGYGWMITQQSGHRLIKHGGRIPGFTAHLARYPDDRVTVIILSNWDRLNPIELNDELAAIVFGGQ